MPFRRDLKTESEEVASVIKLEDVREVKPLVALIC